MGAAVAALLRSGAHDVLWASHGRSDATAARAEEAGLRDAGSVRALAAACDVAISVCPPGAAADVARAMAGCRPGGILLAHDGIADARDLVADDPAPDVDRAALLDRVLGGLSDRGLFAISLDKALIEARTVRTMEFARG